MSDELSAAQLDRVEAVAARLYGANGIGSELIRLIDELERWPRCEKAVAEGNRAAGAIRDTRHALEDILYQDPAREARLQAVAAIGYVSPTGVRA